MAGLFSQIAVLGSYTFATDQMAALAERNTGGAFFVCGGKFNMDIQEASACAVLVNARHSIPCHMAPASGFWPVKRLH